MALTPAEKNARKMQRLMARTCTCLLCGAFATVKAVFKPRHPELWGGQPGKLRFIGYALCTRCFALPDITLKVEARLMRDQVGRRN
jgi:hypothetical protein